MELVEKEMEWTVNWFKLKEGLWKEIAENETRAGHRAYAWKESWMWGRWATNAYSNFESVKAVKDS